MGLGYTKNKNGIAQIKFCAYICSLPLHKAQIISLTNYHG